MRPFLNNFNQPEFNAPQHGDSIQPTLSSNDEKDISSSTHLFPFPRGSDSKTFRAQWDRNNKEYSYLLDNLKKSLATQSKESQSKCFYDLGLALKKDQIITVNEIWLNKKKCFTRALELFPDNSAVFDSLGSLLNEKETITVNKKVFDKKSCWIQAAKINPKQDKIFVKIASLLNHKENFNLNGEIIDKKGCYVKTLSFDSNSSTAWMELGTILYKNYEEINLAEKIIGGKYCFIKVLELDPHNELAFTRLGALLENNETVEIEGVSYDKKECVVQALKLNPFSANAFNTLFIVWNTDDTVEVNGEKFTNKKECLFKALKLQPNLAIAYNNLAFVLEPGEIININNKNYNSKIELFVQALEIDAELQRAYHNLASELSNNTRVQVNNEWLDKKGCYLKILEINPNSAWAFNGLGYSLDRASNEKITINNSQWSKEQCYLKAIQLKPDMAIAYRNLGNMMGDTQFDKIKMGEKWMSKFSFYHEATEIEDALAKKSVTRTPDRPVHTVIKSEVVNTPEFISDFTIPKTSGALLAISARESSEKKLANDDFNNVPDIVNQQAPLQLPVQTKNEDVENLATLFTELDLRISMNEIMPLLQHTARLGEIARSQQISYLLLSDYLPPAGKLRDYHSAFTIGLERQYATAQILTSGQFNPKSSIGIELGKAVMNAGTSIARGHNLVALPFVIAGQAAVVPWAIVPSLFSGILTAVAYRQNVDKTNAFTNFLSCFHNAQQYSQIISGIAQDVCMSHASKLQSYETSDVAESDNEHDKGKQKTRETIPNSLRNTSRAIKNFIREYNLAAIKNVPTDGEPTDNIFLENLGKFAKNHNFSVTNTLLATPIQRKALWDVAAIFEKISGISEEEKNKLKGSSDPVTSWRNWLGRELSLSNSSEIHNIEIQKIENSVTELEHTVSEKKLSLKSTLISSSSVVSKKDFQNLKFHYELQSSKLENAEREIQNLKNQIKKITGKIHFESEDIFEVESETGMNQLVATNSSISGDGKNVESHSSNLEKTVFSQEAQIIKLTEALAVIEEKVNFIESKK